MQAIALGRRYLSRIGKRHREAPAHLRAVNVARRSYMAYRIAITGADLAMASDEINHTEKYLCSTYTHKVSHEQAQKFFR